jgi:hypothetical protein
VLIGTVFAYLGGGKTLFGVDMRSLVFVRAGLAGVLGVATGWMVVARNPARSLPLLVRGCAVGAPVPVLAMAAWKLRPRIGALPEFAQVGVAIVGFTLVTGLLAASVHLLIKAFDAPGQEAKPA